MVTTILHTQGHFQNIAKEYIVVTIFGSVGHIAGTVRRYETGMLIIKARITVYL